MNDEEIIRDEATQFAERKVNISPSSEPIEQMEKVKSRLFSFYSPESKSIFLDEIEKVVVGKLQRHRDEAHGGEAKADCGLEIRAEKLLFYLRQEVKTLPTIAHQRNPDKIGLTRDKVFVSYCHEDKEHLDEIKKHFKPFLNKINFWDDSYIVPGQKWKKEIKQAIAETKVAILLVSAGFLGSDFIASDELPPLLKAAENEGAVILIVVLKPCLWEEFPELNQYQAMNSPSKPLAKLEYIEQQEVFVNLVRQTKKIIDNT